MKMTIEKPVIKRKEILKDAKNKTFDKFYDEVSCKKSIAFLSSGIPSHSCIKTIDNFEIFAERDSQDHFGMATLMSGVAVGDDRASKSFIGICPTASVYFIKVSKNNGEVLFNSFIAGLIWRIIKDSSVIVVPFSLNMKNNEIEDLFNKAKERNIYIVSSCKNVDNLLEYDNVIFTSVDQKKSDKYISVNYCDLYTSYQTEGASFANYAYVPCKGYALSSSVVGALMLRMLSSKNDVSKKDIIEQINNLF